MMQQMTKRRKSLKKPMADKGRGVRIVLQLCYNFFFFGGGGQWQTGIGKLEYFGNVLAIFCIE